MAKRSGRRAAPVTNTNAEAARRAELQRKVADFLLAGVSTNLLAINYWSEWSNAGKHIDFAAMLAASEDVAARVGSGDLSGPEALLAAQVSTLNSIFTKSAIQAHQAERTDQTELYLRLALKAQSQCRATVETLALLKNPPIFAAQANISAGPQQVNNRVQLTRADIQETAPNKLLEASGERLDERATSKTIAVHSSVETVGAIDRPSDRRGEGTSVHERVQRRRESR